jgi:hypothetical protein
MLKYCRDGSDESAKKTRKMSKNRGRLVSFLLALSTYASTPASAEEPEEVESSAPPERGPSRDDVVPAVPEPLAGPKAEPVAESTENVNVGAPEESPAPPSFSISGYIDVGFAKAEGNGSSFAPGDTATPADYFVDAFAPAVNARGEVASTDAAGRATSGFLPRSIGIGNKASFLINTANVDLRYQSPTTPVMMFTRVQFLPRFEATGETTHVVIDQAFGRIAPFTNADLTLSLGKFDSVFGIEYLENQANFRIGITPSLMARYTTGTSVGGKVFFRQQLPTVSSAVSLNVAATNSGNMVDSLQGPDRSLTGVPVVSARLGYELIPSRFFLKLGVSALSGPRNDQRATNVKQTLLGADLRFFVAGFFVNAEYVHVDEVGAEGVDGKLTGLGPFPASPDFYAHTVYVFAGQEISLPWDGPRKLTIYGRYDNRHAHFENNPALTVDRFTVGFRVHLWDCVLAKGEMLINRELAGAPTVANNVWTSSVVWTW